MPRIVARVRSSIVVPVAVVVVLVASVLVGVVAPTTPVSAATVTFGTIQAQMADHRGRDNGTSSGNCIRYSPPNNATSSAYVINPNEAITAHGSRGSCPSSLSTANQSAVGFRPGTATSIPDGTPFLVGRMVHYNNPISADDRYFTGTLNIRFSSFPTTTIAFPWTLDETPNTPGPVNDEIAFANQISTVTLVQGGLTFRLVVNGFIPTGTATACPASPSGTPQNVFSTVEGAETHACLYGTIQQSRTLTIVKQVVGSAPGTPSFGFTSSSAFAGSPWSNGAFSLGSAGTLTRDLTSGNTVTVTETDPNDDRWTVTALACTEIGASGVPQAVQGATVNVAARQVVLANVPPPANVGAPGITCTYTNTYTPRSTLTLVKQVQSGSAAANLWTLTATGSVVPPPSGAVISGPSGSAAVTVRRVPAGAYALTETGTGAAATGYVQVGDWACRTAGGAVVPVTAGTVTLTDSAAATTSANVTCTATNRLATGSLQISKVVDAPSGGYTGGATKTFSGAYDCGTGSSGTFSTLTTAAPVVVSGIPAGRACTVTENAPTGGLANASYAWGTPSFSTQPVTVADQGTASVTITNNVVQRFGTFALTKSIVGPDGTTGYTGGTARIFPVAYSCTLTNGPTTTGALDLTATQAVSPTTPIPTGSVCTFTETLITQPGDFADPSYVWTPPPTVTPPSLTIGDGTTVTATLTNTFTRQFGSLIIAKAVDGGGYLGGTTPNFTVLYSCGTGFEGAVTIADGANARVDGLPAGLTCAAQEIPPAPDLLSPAFTWGTATWTPGPTATIVANGTTTVTVSNPTIPIFGQVSITKAVTGETQGIGASATFRIVATCSNGGTYPFDLGVDATATTPDLPVGTSCTITEDPPTGGLIDGSYAWGPTPPPQTVTITESGQVVAMTMTNSVVRVTGQLTITKQPITPAGVVDPGRLYAVDYSCVYGNDPAVSGTVQLSAGGGPATIGPLLIGSRCSVGEDPATLVATPSATDPSWVWLPPIVTPGDAVLSSPTTPLAVGVTNSIRQLTSGFNVTKRVTGAGRDGGYPPGATFDFAYACADGTNGNFVIADGASFASTAIPAFTPCTVSEIIVPPTTSPAFGWDPVEFAVSVGGSQTGNSVSFVIPDDPAGAQVNVTNPISLRLASVRVDKVVTGLTEGLDPAAPPFTVTLDCGPGQVYQLDVPAAGSAIQAGIPIGSSCTASESTPTGGLVDESYAWGPPTFVPADATVIVSATTTVAVEVQNPIVRVTAPVQLVKTYAGAQGIIDPARTYPITWSCTYRGVQVAGGTVDVVADPTGITVGDVPPTSSCTATEGGLGAPSTDPAFRWLVPVITGTTVTIPGPNTITVANELVRDSGTVLVGKQVIGETQGYVNLGTGAQDFTLHGSCDVPADPSIPRRFADGTIADGGEVPITASIGWTCAGYEDTPGQDLLVDASYAWAPVILDPAGEFILTRDAPTRIFLAQNPIVRVRSAFSIEKVVVDPNGVVDPAAQYSGTFSCQYGTDTPVAGPWTLGAGETFTVPDVLLTSVCTVTETTPSQAGLPDGSWTWAAPQISAPATVVAGATASVTVTNTPARLFAGLQVTKDVIDTVPSGVLPGASFGGVWTCTQGSGVNETTYSSRFTVAADGTSPLFGPADQVVPATAVCRIIEDTLATDSLRDGSFAWDEPSYVPEDPTVTLEAGETSSVGIVNTIVRVYSDVTVNKTVIGPAAGLVPSDRPFTGTITCQYSGDEPVTTTWSSTLATPTLRAGVLVGSVCSALEDPPGRGGQPVTGDSSYIWRTPIVSAPVTVTPPIVPTPPIVVTNPTDRLFGTFTATKSVSGAIEGIVDPSAPYVMNWICVDGLGDTYEGQLEVPFSGTRAVGPEQQIPTASECTLNEPLAEMPELADDAWQWQDPTFTIDGEPVVGEGRVLAFTIPTPQEDTPEPNVAVGITNTVLRTAGAFTLAKTSDPPSGTVVQPGSIVSYTVTLTSTGAVPVHDVVVTDDLSGVVTNATLVAGSIAAPAGTTADTDTAAQQLVWTVGDVPAGDTLTLTYQVQISPGAGGVAIRNRVTGTADVPSGACTPAAPCTVDHSTSTTPYVTKDVLGDPTRNRDTGEWTVAYRVVVTNPDAANAAPYNLSDTLGFAPGLEIRSAAVTAAPPAVTLATPAWNGSSNVTIATGPSLPAGGSHTYDISVVVFVPLDTPAGALGCTATPATAGSGLFNAARVESLGAVSTDSACAPVALLLQVAKRWVIDGREYAEGSQPAGYLAELTLDGGVGVWSTRYLGYQPGTTVQVAERTSVPPGCSNTSAGVGPLRLTTALTAVTVTNTVVCGALPGTGWHGQASVVAATIFVLAGGTFLGVGRRRRLARSTR